MVRIRTVDFAKGAAISVIVIMHALFCQPSMTADTVRSSPLVDFMYAGLFLFFIFSGYFTRPERLARENITRRLIQLTLVSSLLLILFPAVLYVYYIILGIPVVPDDYFSCLWMLIGGDNVFKPIGYGWDSISICGVFPGYYFVQMMIVSFILFYPTVKYAVRSWRTMVIAVLIMTSLTAFCVGILDVKLPLYAHLSPLGTAFMYVGTYIKRYDLIDYIDTHHRDRKYWLIFIAAAVAAAVLLIVLPPGHRFDWGYFGAYGGWSVYPFFITMLPCCYVLMVIFSLFAKIPAVSDIFCCFGKHTLAILLCHGFLLKIMSAPTYGVTTVSWLPSIPFLQTILFGVAAVIIPVIVMEGIPYLKRRYAKNSDASAGQASQRT